MYDIGKSLDNQILEVMKNRPTVVLTEALEPRIIEAACSLPRARCRPPTTMPVPPACALS